MTTIFSEYGGKIFLTAPATILKEDMDTASSWASSYVRPHPYHRWILARYVEADNANSNGQFWTLDDLVNRKDTIVNTAMNVNHQSKNIVGTWSAAELMYPEEQSSYINPYVETLGVYWQWGNDDGYKAVEEAFNAGNLHVSMECIADTVTCGGDHGCGAEFAYQGPSGKYCEHILDRASYRILNNPTFLGGAIILPGTQPGWKAAYVKELSALFTQKEQETLLTDIAYSAPDSSDEDVEQMMLALQMNFLMSTGK